MSVARLYPADCIQILVISKPVDLKYKDIIKADPEFVEFIRVAREFVCVSLNTYYGQTSRHRCIYSSLKSKRYLGEIDRAVVKFRWWPICSTFFSLTHNAIPLRINLFSWRKCFNRPFLWT